MLLLRVKISLKLNPVWFPRMQGKRKVKEKKENSQYLVTDNEAQNNLNHFFFNFKINGTWQLMWYKILYFNIH